MKRIFLVFAIGMFVIVCFFGYVIHKVHRNFNNNNVSIQVQETDNTYQLKAYFARNKTRMLQRYIDSKLHTSRFFYNTNMDATVTLDDKTHFYIRTSPGRLLIKLDKSQNDFDAYFRVKEMGEGIKRKLAED